MSPTLVFWLLVVAVYAAVWAVLAGEARAARQEQEVKSNEERTSVVLW